MWVSQSDGWTLRSLARLGPTDLQAASEKEEEHLNPCVGVAKEASQSCVCSGNLARGYSSALTQQQLAMVARWVWCQCLRNRRPLKRFSNSHGDDADQDQKPRLASL